jgi:anti-sigma B factor antagonist
VSEQRLFEVVYERMGLDGCRLRCVGELDLATAPLLRDALDPITAQVELDFTDVTFLDSQGAAVLIAQQQRLRERGCALHITGLHGEPRRALEILGVVDELT